MKKYLKVLALLLLCACLMPGSARGAAPQEDPAALILQAAEAQRARYAQGGALLSQQDLLPAGDSAVADWFAIAMARSGIPEDYDTYLVALRRYVESAYAGEGLSLYKATEWHRIALAVTALGGDASAFGTHSDGTPIDLIADGCYNCVVEGGPGAQGLNGWIYALLTVDSGGYAAGESAVYTREDMLGAILAAQAADGGFSLDGGPADADITAMALQALAPYADQYGEAIDRGLTALSALQLENGGFSSWGAESAESSAQVILALCALGLDPEREARFMKPGGDPVAALLRFRTEDGSFAHTDTADPMATEQAMQALEALRRLRAGEDSFFQMKDAAKPPQWTQQAAEAVPAADKRPGAAVYILPAVLLAAGTCGVLAVRKKKGSDVHE